MPSTKTGTTGEQPIGAAQPAVLRLAGSPTRVVLDTNTVLDWLVFAEPAATAVGAAITARRLRWLATPHMLAELRVVLARPLPERWEQARELALTIDLTPWVTICAEPALRQRLVCRDPTDQVFIDLARECRPSLLLTRDRALLALRRRAADVGVQVATAHTWLAARPD